MKITSRIHRMIGYDGAALLMLEFCVFAAVLSGVILPIAKRRIKRLHGGELSSEYLREMNKYYTFAIW